MPVVALLTVAGLHVPVIPFVDIAGSVGGTVPAQIAGTVLKVGNTEVVTVTVSIVVVAHCPAPGVNV
jgi:hypothetical protein